MQSSSYSAFNLNLSKDFVKKVHSHPLVTHIQDLSTSALNDKMWESQPEIITHSFGGMNNNQFKSDMEITEFLTEYLKLFKGEIEASHRDPLLYMMTFQYNDSELQSVRNNEHNRLNSSGQFLLDLFIYGFEHLQKTANSGKYFLISDETHGNWFFSTKNPDNYKDIEDHYAPGMIQYQIFKIGKSEILVPDDLNVSAITNDGKIRATISDVPPQYKYELWDGLINKMIGEHEDAQSDYYKLFAEGSYHINQMKTFSVQKRIATSNESTILKVGSLIMDYLKAHYPDMTKIEITDFLYGYFALFKAYKMKDNVELPSNYSELLDFYRSQKITKATIKDKFKDICITGYF